MRALAFLVLAACSATIDTSSNDATPPSEDGNGDDPGDSSPIWSYTTPAAMRQLPQVDEAAFDTVRFLLRGFDQVATAATPEGAELAVTPTYGARRPMRILSERTQNRALVWMLAPLGLLWHNAILWDDGTVDPGRLLYHVLEGGVMNVTWSRPPSEAALAVELSVPPTPVGPAVYRVGTLRVRIVAGRATLAGRVLTVVPSGAIQILVYTDPHYDTAAVDPAGALLDPSPDRVSVVPGPVLEKHVRFTSNVLAIDHVHALGITPSTAPGLALDADRAVLSADAVPGWSISALAAKIIKTGPIGMRRMRYAHAPTRLGGQTFNFYVFSPRGTVTLWSVGRIVEPYRLAMYDGVVLADFPATQNDYSEDLPGGTDVMSTRTAWAFDATTLLEASTMTANATIAHTGQEGNSVDGGWRHTSTGPLSELRVGDGTTFTAVTATANNYRYDAGNAVQAVYPTHAVFHHQRAWSGAWAERAQRLAALHLASTTYFGSIKDLHNTDQLTVGKSLEVAQVLHVAPGAPEDPAVLHARYALPAQRLRGGMLDLDGGAELRAPWDLAIRNDEVVVAFAK